MSSASMDALKKKFEMRKKERQAKKEGEASPQAKPEVQKDSPGKILQQTNMDVDEEEERLPACPTSPAPVIKKITMDSEDGDEQDDPMVEDPVDDGDEILETNEEIMAATTAHDDEEDFFSDEEGEVDTVLSDEEEEPVPKKPQKPAPKKPDPAEEEEEEEEEEEKVPPPKPKKLSAIDKMKRELQEKKAAMKRQMEHYEEKEEEEEEEEEEEVKPAPAAKKNKITPPSKAAPAAKKTRKMDERNVAEAVGSVKQDGEDGVAAITKFRMDAENLLPHRDPQKVLQAVFRKQRAKMQSALGFGMDDLKSWGMEFSELSTRTVACIQTRLAEAIMKVGKGSKDDGLELEDVTEDEKKLLQVPINKFLSKRKAKIDGVSLLNIISMGNKVQLYQPQQFNPANMGEDSVCVMTGRPLHNPGAAKKDTHRVRYVSVANLMKGSKLFSTDRYLIQDSGINAQLVNACNTLFHLNDFIQVTAVRVQEEITKSKIPVEASLGRIIKHSLYGAVVSTCIWSTIVMSMKIIDEFN